MFVDSETYSRLKKENGFGMTISSIIAKKIEGINGLKYKDQGNVFFMENGLFLQVAFGPKAYFPIESIIEFDLAGRCVSILISEEEDDIVVKFTCGKEVEAAKFYNALAEFFEKSPVDVGRIKAEVKNEKRKELLKRSDDLLMRQSMLQETEQNKNAVMAQKPPTQRQLDRARIKRLKHEGVPMCPKCKSTSVIFQKKGLSVTRAAVGGILIGKTGAILGGFTSKKGKLKCLNCGHTWKI